MDILFDIDDTLFPSSEFSSLARRNAINAMISMGLDLDYDDLRSRLDSIIAAKGSNYGRHFDDLLAEIGVVGGSRFVAAAIAAYHDTKTAIQPFPKVPMTLLRLRESGHRLYVATRGNGIKQWDKLIRLRLALFFGKVFVCQSEEKDERFYRDIISQLGGEAKSCVMVGDREDTDIIPAKAAGMRTIRVIGGKYSSVPTSADRSITDFGALTKIVQEL